METLRFILKVWRYNTILPIGPAKLQELQQQKLRTILRFTRDHSKYYRRLWEGIDIEKCRLEDLPVVRKAELMSNFEDVVTDPRLKKDEITAWMNDLNNVSKYYLDSF